MWLLAVVECMEVMVEVMSELVMREPGKWVVVILMQCMKAVLRAVLVFYMRSGLLTSPSVPSPDRKQAKVQSVYLKRIILERPSRGEPELEHADVVRRYM